MRNISREQAKHIARITIVSILSMSLGAFIFYFGYQRGALNPKKVVVENITNAETTELKTDFSVFWEAWQLVKEEHLKGDEVKDHDLLYGAITGMVNALKDPHTVFFSPDDSKKFEEDVNGSFGGIGAEIGIRKEQLIVIAPLKGNPAEKAGLKAGDKILAIDTVGTHGISVDDAVKKIRGVIGTVVTLTIMRDEWEKPRDIPITRGNIIIPTLEWKFIQDPADAEGANIDTDGSEAILVDTDSDITHITLFSFNQNAPGEFYKASLKVLLGNVEGVILDLRNNPGGFLEVAIDLAGWFLDKGTVVVTEQFRNGNEVEFRARGNGALKDIPMVILTNEGSASASEILAGSLHAHRKIKLIGEKTFGKGTVQELRKLSDGSEIKLTIAHWVLPDGTIIDEEGIKPDIEVKNPEVEGDEKQKDLQLEKAIQVLRQDMRANSESAKSRE
ncbi:MAG: S41 family peptidase [bacterium]|nr:S41 family peptidase [bacterium]